MNEPTNNFRDRLLDKEKATPTMKEEYSNKMRANFDRFTNELIKWRFGMALFLAISFLIMGLVMSCLAWQVPGDFSRDQIIAQTIMIVAGLLCFGLSIPSILYFRHRPPNPVPPNPRVDATVKKALPWLMLGCAVGGALFGVVQIASDKNYLLIFFVVYVTGLLISLDRSIRKSEKRTHEKLLEIECRLAELSESLNRDKPSSP
jgi:hypothetical protein